MEVLMQTKQGSTLQSLRNVEDFLDQHADVLADIVQGGSRRKLDDVIKALEVHVSRQAASALESRGATQQHYARRRALLRDHMAPIARIAVLELSQCPQLAAFRMPRTDIAAERLAAAAFGMASAARLFAFVFVDAGLPVDFADRLSAAGGAMLQSLDERAYRRSTQGGATAGLRTSLSHGRKLVHVLDALVQSALADDAALRAGWNSAKRVRLVSVRHAPPSATTASEDSHGSTRLALSA
jgi:hypothetical protein